MTSWQKRLVDLAQLLLECHYNYMEPKQFRRSADHFLQTARTVTFNIQKNKDSILGFNEWYGENVLKAWEGNDIMQWAEDSRITIEKESDLDLHSTISLKISFGSSVESVRNIEMSNALLMHTAIDELVRIAQKRLPSGVPCNAVIKINRRWVANSLPKYELLEALCTVYREYFDICSSLTKRLKIDMDTEIIDPRVFDAITQTSRRIKYYKSSSASSFSVRTERETFMQDQFTLEEVGQTTEISEFDNEGILINTPLQWLSELAESTFDREGYHVPTAFFYTADWVPIDMITFQPDETTDKHSMWREIGDRVRSMGANAISFVGNAWTDEQLQVIILDGIGNYRETKWGIVLGNDQPTLRRIYVQEPLHDSQLSLLAPVMSALGVSKLQVVDCED